MGNLNFDEERVLNTPIILYVDYISLHFKKYLNNNYPEITPRDFTYLTNIFYHQNISQKELSDLLFVSEPNVAQIIKRLEKNEFIERTIDETNKSRKIINVTEKGKLLVFSLLKIIWNWEYEFFKEYDKEDIEKFRKTIYDFTDKTIS